MKPYLFSFLHGVGDEFPISYQLVYAENANEALISLQNHFYGKIYDIHNCTI